MQLMNHNESLLNTSLPMTMHIDLNSCFAIIEQQANRLLRGRPVGIAAHNTPIGFVVIATMMDMSGEIVDRVAFGQVSDI